MKVVLTLGDTPAECTLEIEGKKIGNVLSVEASVDMSDGPIVKYITTNGMTDTSNEIKFNPKIEDKKFNEIFRRR